MSASATGIGQAARGTDNHDVADVGNTATIDKRRKPGTCHTGCLVKCSGVGRVNRITVLSPR